MTKLNKSRDFGLERALQKPSKGHGKKAVKVIMFPTYLLVVVAVIPTKQPAMLTILTSFTREEIFLCFLCVFNLCDFRAVFLNDDRLPFETKQIQYNNILSLVLLKLI